MLVPIGSSGILKKSARVTQAIIAVNVILYSLRYSMSEGEYRDLFMPLADDLGLIFSQPLRIFLHADIYHIAGNMIFFWAFGRALEDKMGRVKYFVFYMAAGVISGIICTLMMSMGCIGASGAISGVMGAFLVRLHYKKINMTPILPVPILPFAIIPKLKIPLSASFVLLWYFISDIQGAMEQFDNSWNPIGYWAHISGFVFGAAISGIAIRKKSVRVERHIEDVERMASEGGIMTTIAEPAAKVLDIDPKNTMALRCRAEAITRYGPCKEGENLYKRAIRLHVNSEEINTACEVAIEMLNRCDEIMDAACLRKIEMHLVRSGRSAIAARMLEKWLKKFPKSVSSPMFSVDLAMIYIKYFMNDANDYGGAAELARKILGDVIENHPGSLYAQKASAMLERIPVYEPPHFEESGLNA